MNTNYKPRTCRKYLIENRAKIEQLMHDGHTLRSTYQMLKSGDNPPTFTSEAFRAALKRHRPDLHKLIAYGNPHTLSPAKTEEKERISTAAKLNLTPPVTKKWVHNKVPDESLFRKAEDSK